MNKLSKIFLVIIIILIISLAIMTILFFNMKKTMSYQDEYIKQKDILMERIENLEKEIEDLNK